MAQVHIRGTNVPIEVSDVRARSLKADFVADRLPKIIEIDSMSVRSAEIKMIVLDSEVGASERRLQDMTTEELFFLVGFDFERLYKSRNVGGFVYNDAFGVQRSGFLDWCREIGVCTVRAVHGQEVWSLHPSFADFSRKVRALQEIRDRRAYAQEQAGSPTANVRTLDGWAQIGH